MAAQFTPSPCSFSLAPKTSSVSTSGLWSPDEFWLHGLGWDGQEKQANPVGRAGPLTLKPVDPSFHLHTQILLESKARRCRAASCWWPFFPARRKNEARVQSTMEDSPTRSGGPPASLPVRESEGASQVPLLSVWIMFQLCFCHETTRWSSVNINK